MPGLHANGHAVVRPGWHAMITLVCPPFRAALLDITLDIRMGCMPINIAM